MRPTLYLFVAAACGLSVVHAAEKFTLTVSHDLPIARPAETVVVPWTEVASRLPGVLIDHLVVKNASGTVIPLQVTNFRPEVREGHVDELIFQHDFAAGEKSATFTIETTPDPVPPFPSKVYARYVPERFDDFAFENDRLAHRMYGPGLDTPAAEATRLKSSGIDIWSKKVRYLIVDRWYLKGHDNYHKDTGEGIDMYSVGPARGCGGTGIWDGKQLYVSGNYKTWKVLANGPLRAVFELTYDTWDASGVKVSEVKRFTVDAGRNFHQVESTFSSSGNEPLMVAIGVTKHKPNKQAVSSDAAAGWLSLWEEYPKDGQLGTAVILEGAKAEFAEDAANHLVVTKATPGQPVRYCVGAGWDRSGDFPSKESWDNYVTTFVQRRASPLKLSYGK